MLQTSLLLMKSLNKTKAPICNVFFVSKGNLFLLLFYYTAGGVSAVSRP